MIGSYAYTGVGHDIDEDAAWDYIHHGYLLAPRTVLKGRSKLPHAALPDISIDPDKLSMRIEEAIMASMGNMHGTRRAVMFSGGFDSMLIACLAQRAGAQVTAVTVQFDTFNPLTVAGSINFAKKAGIAHHILRVTAAEFLIAFEAIADITDEPLLDLELAVVYAALKNYDLRIAGDTFISGMGCDQWFGNMALMAKPEELAVRLDWASVNEDAHHRVANALGRKFVFPFLSKSMLALSHAVPSSMKKDKKLLRALAGANMIPSRGAKSEVQVPALIHRILIKMYGDRAWPGPVTVPGKSANGVDQTLRQIILGLWLEKAKDRIARA